MNDINWQEVDQMTDGDIYEPEENEDAAPPREKAHALGSLWVGVCYTSYADHPGYDVDMPRSCCDLILKTKIKSFRKQNDIEIHSITPAYTGDELGALLNKSSNLPNYPVGLTVHDKVALAIQGLKEGLIKKEEFKY